MTTPILAYPLKDALYLNLTSACTLACTFCPKIRDGNFTVGGFDLKLTANPSADEVWSALVALGPLTYSEVVFTGFGEPTRRFEVLLELVRRLKSSSVARVRLDTDGLASLREGKDVPPVLASAGLDAVSVSLNAPDAETYERICPSRYGRQAFLAVKEFLKSATGALPEVVATVVAVPGVSLPDCRRVAEELGARFRPRPFDRVGRIDPKA